MMDFLFSSAVVLVIAQSGRPAPTKEEETLMQDTVLSHAPCVVISVQAAESSEHVESLRFQGDGYVQCLVAADRRYWSR
jgi:hypothetical protein